MKSFDNDVNNGLTNNFLIDNLEINNKKGIFKNKTNSNFYSINKMKIRIEKPKENDIDYKKLPQDLKNSINSSINYLNENKYLYEEKPIYYDKLLSSIKLQSNEKIPFSRTAMIRMKPKISRDTFLVKNFDNNPKTNSINGSYYKKRNNSIIIIKDKNNSNINVDNNVSESLGNVNNKIPKQKVAKKLKNITIEHLKDLLDIKEDKSQGQQEEIIPYFDNYSSNLNPFDSYLERTRLDNERNLNKININEEIRRYKNKRKDKSKRSSLQNEDVINIIDEALSQKNIEKEVENETIEKDKNKKIVEHVSDIINVIDGGVQCGMENKNIESSNKTVELENFTNRESDEIITNNIITNAKLRDKIKWDKLKQKNEDNDNILNINMYNSQFVEGRNEIFKLYFQNKINIDSRFKLKTPNDLKSRIGNENKINNIKKASSANPKIKNNIYIKSYSKDDDNYQQKYMTHIKNFYNSKEKFKQFFQIKDVEEAQDLKFCKNKTKRNNSNIQKENPLKSENIEDNIKILKKRVFSPVNNNIVVYNNIIYNLKNNENENNDNQEKLGNIKREDQKYLEISQNNNDDLLKVYFNKNNNKENENLRISAFNDNCNTSNGFLNFGEFNFLDKNNVNKNSNNPFNSSMKSKLNDSNILILSINKSPENRFSDKREFLEKVNWKDNKTVKIIQGGYLNKNIEENDISNKNNNIRDKSVPKTTNSFNQNYIPNITNSQYYLDETSKNKFKILKKQLNKNSEKVFNMLDNLKRAQCDLTDSKRKFLVDSNENKLKRHTIRSSIKISNS